MSKVTDLEVLSKYLSEDELKDVARQVAYELFKSSIGVDNPHAKVNLEYYIKHGAYEAVVQHATENGVVDIDELSKSLNTKVAKIITGLESYQIPYQNLITEAVQANKETIVRHVEETIKNAMEDTEKYNSIYQQVNSSIGEYLGDTLMNHLKESLNK